MGRKSKEKLDVKKVVGWVSRPLIKVLMNEAYDRGVSRESIISAVITDYLRALEAQQEGGD